MSFLDNLWENKGRTLLGVALLVICGALVIDWLVLTEEERIEAMLQQACAQVVAGDADSVLRHLSDSYASAWVSRAHIAGIVRERRFTSLSAGLGTVIFDPKDASRCHARVSASAVESTGEAESRWLQVYFVKEGEAWRILGMALWGTGM